MLSCHDSTFELDSAESQTFPGRLRVIAGSGALSQSGQVEAGRKINVSKDVSYVLRSAPEEDLTVEVLGVRNKGYSSGRRSSVLKT